MSQTVVSSPDKHSARLFLSNWSSYNLLHCIGEYSHEMKKMIYMENRRFLPLSHPLRKQTDGFPSRSTEERPPPEAKNMCDMLSYHQAYENAKNKYVHVQCHTCNSTMSCMFVTCMCYNAD